MPPIVLNEKAHAKFFYRLYLIFRCINVTLWSSLDSIRIGLFVKKANKRRRVDNRIDKWSGSLLKYIKVKIEVEGEDFEFDDSKPYVLMSNHLSHFDIPLIFQAMRHESVRMLTKKELFKVPIWGRGMTSAEFIAIDRENRRQAHRDLEMAKKAMESGIRLWVAPEGSRSRDGNIQSFKKGGFKIAIDTGATILPIGIIGSNKIIPPNKFQFYTKQNAKVVIGKPIDASKYSKEKIKDLIEVVKKQIVELAEY